MNGQVARTRDLVPPERLAEAGVWIARLHGEQRGPTLEAAFRQWLQAHTLNARAFELATEVWEDAQNLRRVVSFGAGASPRRRIRFSFAVAAIASVAVIVTVAVLYLRLGGVTTGVGEQRMLTLNDGSRVYLNTNSRAVVRYGKAARRVELRSGEALFEVAKRPDWPFIVTSGDHQIRALGTSFVVRREEQGLAVTLVEGKISVSPASSGDAPATPGHGTTKAQPAHPSMHVLRGKGASGEVFVLAPGQRLTFGTTGVATLDTPSLDKATAWRRGQVVLDDTPLSSAVIEMNRYNSAKLVIEQPEARGLLVNGLFQAGDSESFANAVAQAYRLHVVERGDEIILSGIPASAAQSGP